MRTLRRRLLVAASVLSAASVVYRRISERQDAQRYPPPGDLVDIGGRCLHLMHVGTGGPTVVLIPALGATGLEWLHIQQALASHTSVVLYDRAGLGWSDAGPWRQTMSSMADELHELLSAAAIRLPYLLVGQSIGGVIARQYAARYPSETAGMVLVESSHEGQGARLSAARGRDYRVDIAKRIAWILLTPQGIARVTADLGITTKARAQAEREFLPEVVEAGFAMRRTARCWRADLCELISYIRMRGQPPILGDLPLTVITAGIRPGPGRAEWLAMQQEMVALSTKGKQVWAERSSHHVQQYEPGLIVDAVLEMRAGST